MFNTLSRNRTIHYFFIGLSLMAYIFLNGCSTCHKKDGPPSFYVDETKVHDAVPKVEPLSRLGNKPHYAVFGKTYHVMRSSKNYEEVGIASWYGTQFHSRHTSNGERYDMLAMTAAHKTLPLPTYLEVTNLSNNRKIIVKVNDRGPFEAHRIIDLSYVAAKKLHMLGHGTARVRLRAIDPVVYANQHSFSWSSLFAKNTTVHHQIINNKNSGIYLQVGAFRSRHNAEQLQQKLNNMLTSPVNVSRTNRLYQVKVGPFKNMADAKRITKKLHTYGLM